MNTTMATATDLAANVVRQIGEGIDVEVVIFPPYPNLEPVWRIVEGSAIQLGSQDLFWEDSGAFTGEVSALMLTAVGCRWSIVGHSERRRILGESSQVVNRKLHAALRHDLQVILAVGETRDERRGGETERVLTEQIQESIADVSETQMQRVVIAYEPVWAIGTGDTAKPEQAREAHAFIRGLLGTLYGKETAEATRIQYGGSCTPHNAHSLLSEPDIDGALVGGASLKASDFAAIVEAARP
jgi:triosephosphate isomerase